MSYTPPLAPHSKPPQEETPSITKGLLMMSKKQRVEAVALKACPFCGGSKVKTFGPYGWYSQWGISHSCSSFYNGASDMFKGFATEAEAIAAWNTRQPSVVAEEIVAALKKIRALIPSNCAAWGAEQEIADICDNALSQASSLQRVEEPTEEMLKAGSAAAAYRCTMPTLRAIYKAMRSAAPTLTADDDVLEVVARAMFEDSAYNSIRWESATDELKESFRKPARAVLTALGYERDGAALSIEEQKG